MKKMTVLAFALVLCWSTTHAQSKKIKQVAAAVENLRVAMVDGNGPVLRSLIDDSLTYGHSSGHVDSHDDFLKKFETGQSDFVSINLTEQTIQVSGNVAVVRHKLDAVTNDNNKPGEAHLRVLLIWKKEGKNWKLLARQAVKQS